MENLSFEFEGGVKPLPAGAPYVVVGIVASSNLEVLAERKDLGGKCRFEIATAAANFSDTWKAVLIDFMDRSKPRDVLFSINDFSAIPPVVSLRLDQALEQLARSKPLMNPNLHISYLEATARRRIAGLLDPGTFHELIPPTLKRISPHLGLFDAPVAFDDGAIIGEGKLDGKDVYVFAQEGKFRGGSLGEIHSAKITGLLRRAAQRQPAAVIGLFDSGGVRLEEANAGEIGATEIIRGIFDAQKAGVPVIGVLGGSTGCFGGAGITSCCCDTLIASEEGRLSVSGPEVIETVMGVEAFDSRDRALVWRTTGGKNRFLFGTVTELVDDHIPAFRSAVVRAMTAHKPPSLANLKQDLERLKKRIEAYGKCSDATQIWQKMGLDAENVAAMSSQELKAEKEHIAKI